MSKRITTPAIVRTSEVRQNPSGMRPESLEVVRDQRAKGKAMRRIVVEVYPDGGAVLGDGRHRLAVARELGDRTIEATIRYYGPRAGLRGEVHKRLEIDD